MTIDLSLLSKSDLIELSEDIHAKLQAKLVAETTAIYTVQGGNYTFLYSTDSLNKLRNWLDLNTLELTSTPLPETLERRNYFIVGVMRMDYEQWSTNPLFKPDPQEK